MKRHLLAAFCSLFLIPAKAAWALPEVSVIAIGSNASYQKDLPNLLYAEDDATRFAQAMTSVGLVPQARTTVLNGPSVAEFRSVLSQLAIQKTITGEPADNRKFIFYYSGHADESGLHLHDGAIPKEELHTTLAQITAHTKVAIIDSCFSGSLTAKGVEPAPAFELPRVEFDEPSGSVFLSSAAGQQFSYESDSLGSSIFTHHLVAGLYGEADGNNDGIVTVDELYQHVYRNTRWQSLNLPVKESQRPEIYASLEGQGAVVLSFPSQTNSSLALEKAVAGEVTIASSRGLQYFRVDKKIGQQKVLKLPAGLYQVSLKKGGKFGKAEIELKPTQMAFLAEDDFTWDKKPAKSVHAKGIAAAKMATPPEDEDSYSRWTTDFGAHTGFLEDRPNDGPYALAAYRYPLTGRGVFTTSAFVAVSHHRQQYTREHRPKDYAAGVTVTDNDVWLTMDSSAVWFGLWPEMDLSDVSPHVAVLIPDIVIDARLAVGQTYHHQDWGGDRVMGAAAPGYHGSVGLIYRFDSGFGIGLRTARDGIVGSRISQTDRVFGNSVAVTLHY